MRFDKVVASRGDAELNKKLDKITTLLTLLIQKSHPSILADFEQDPPDKCVPDEVLRAEDRIDRFLAEVARHEDVDRSRPQSAPDYSRARRWLEQTQREGNIGFLYDWLPRMLTEFAAVDSAEKSDSWNICTNGCGSMAGDDPHTRHCPVCNFVGWCNRLAAPVPPSQQRDECELVTVSGVTAVILATMPNGCAAGYLKECSLPTGWTEEGKEISGRSSYDLPAPPVPDTPGQPEELIICYGCIRKFALVDMPSQSGRKVHIDHSYVPARHYDHYAAPRVPQGEGPK